MTLPMTLPRQARGAPKPTARSKPGTGNDPASEALKRLAENLDEPGADEKAKAPQAVHHYRLRDQAHALEQVGARPARRDEIGFINRVLTVCCLPRRDPGMNRNYVRVNGPYRLTLSAMDPRWGLPYGSYPRLIFAWLCTEVKRTGKKTLPLGRTFSEFMTWIGVIGDDDADDGHPTNGGTARSGGPNGNMTRLRDQVERLFGCAILLSYETKGYRRRQAHLIAEDTELWWNPERPDDATLWVSKVVVGQRLYEEILAHPVPIDLRILRTMRRSPLGIDLFLWLGYKLHGLGGDAPTNGGCAVELSWRQLYRQFGSNNGEANHWAIQHFRSSSLRELRKLKRAWPELGVKLIRGGIRLEPCASTVPRPRLDDIIVRPVGPKKNDVGNADDEDLES